MNASERMPPEAAWSAHGPMVLRVCTAILGDRERGADAAQDTWLRYLRFKDDRGIENLGGWLRRVAVACAIDLLRREPPTAQPLEAGESRPAQGPDQGQVLVAREFAEFVRAQLPRLPESQRIVFRLKTEAELSLAEIAEDLGLALPTVKTHFARACVRLQASLRAFSPEGTHS